VRATCRSGFRLVALALVSSVVALGGVRLHAQQGPAPAAGSQGLFWTVEKDGRTSWLVGSLHLLTADAYPLPASMLAAFAQADTLVEEADPDELTSPDVASQLMAKAFYPPGRSLQTELSAGAYRRVVDKASKAGLPAVALDRMKPWMIAITLAALELQRGGFDPALGIDKHFLDRARTAGKRTRTFEAALDQIGFLEALSPQMQEALVGETLDGTETELSQMRRIAAAWKAGDAAVVEQLLVDTMKDSPGIYQALVVDRNRRWMPALTGCFATARCFVVVGAAHLVGPDGLVAMLTAQGYRVRQR
jgi:uncharacterized protein YbaP (TraB family)